MSVLVSSVVRPSISLSGGQIEQKARELGAQLSFPEGLNIASDFGLIPCVFNGQPAAFELSSDDTEPGEMNVHHFESRSSYASFAAAAYFAASVCLIADGFLRDEDGQEFSGLSLLNWLKSIEQPEPAPEPDELRIEASVVGPRGNGFLQLKLGRVPPGKYLMSRLVESIAIERVPPRLRTPNSRSTIVVRDASKIIAVEKTTSGGRTEA